MKVVVVALDGQKDYSFEMDEAVKHVRKKKSQ